MKAALFVRVSTKDQSYDRQIEDLTAYAKRQRYEIVEVFTEKISGSKTGNERVALGKMLKKASNKEFEVVLVTEVSRIGRNTLEVLKAVEQLCEYGVNLYIQSMNLETITNRRRNPVAQMLLTMLAEFARLERDTTIERIKSGIRQARKEGKHLGRPIGTVKSDEQLKKEYKPVLRTLKQGISLRKTAKIHDLSLNTVRKVNALVGK